MTNAISYPQFKAWDHNGNALVGGKLYSYEPGTSTPTNTYADVDRTIPNSNPVILDSVGEAEVYLDGSAKLVLKDDDDVLLWTKDEVQANTLWTFAPAEAAVFYSSVLYGGTLAAIEAALVEVGSTEATIYLAPDNWLITDDLDIPANVMLKPERGALMVISATKTLTIKNLDAGLYQIFSCTGTGKVVYTGRKYPEWWGAKDDSGTTDNTAPIKAALANGGLTKFEAPNGGYYKCTAALTTAVAATRVFSDSKAEIKQATAATKLFSVSASDVKFRGLVLNGVDSTDSDSFSSNGAIHSEATEPAQLTGLEVSDCEIKNYQSGVISTWMSASIHNNYIHDVQRGVIGGMRAYTPADQNLTGDLEYMIYANRIICTFGDLDDSRPITLPLFTGEAQVYGNHCRGGGMAIENILASATANANRVKITGNDCDTGISASQGDVIGYNTIDLAKAPAGRGQQANFFQAIETGYNATVIGNIVRNHTNGVGNIMPNMRVIGNFFIDCGDQTGLGAVGMGGVVVTKTDQFAADTVMNTIISGNTFNGTKGDVADIYMNWDGAHALIGLTISENMTLNGDYPFFLGKYIQHSKIINNWINNCCTSITGTQVYAIWSDGATGSIEYYNNTVINTVAAPNGVYQAIAPQAGDVIGFNNFTGIRNPALPIEDTNAYQITCSQLVDGAMYSPKRGWFTAAAAASTTISSKRVTSTCQIRLEPTNAAAATLMSGAKSFYVSARNVGVSIVLSTADGNNAAGTETFNYMISD
jgi:hypothetical protein